MVVGTNVMLLPLHNPLRVAEDAATLSLLSGGRFRLGLAAGYRAVEFETFGVSLKNRPSLMAEAVKIIRAAWAGESVRCGGKRYSFPEVRVSPIPERPIELLMGGTSRPAFERALRLADGFLAPRNQYEPFMEVAADIGVDARGVRIVAGQWMLVAEDPECEWVRAAPHVTYSLNSFRSWGYGGSGAELTAAQLLANDLFTLLDGPAAVDVLYDLLAAYPQIIDIHIRPQFPGEPVELGTRRLEYFAAHVIAPLRERLGH
jgi:alkanesulfonate monooxygenase SsuD/methylene tetrahydromethanopterin reductase-like flavin-dependent oxidoreductase (luciferase family)